MKLTHAVLPVAALVAVLLWNLPPWRTRQTLESSSQSLRGQPAAARLSPAREIREKRQPRAAETEAARARKPIDWNYLAAQARLFIKDERVDDDDALSDVTERLAEMTREQLLTALNEVDSLGLEPEIQAMLENAFLEALVEKDPELALTRFAVRIHDDPDGLGTELSPALLAWASKDLTAATAWFDQAIATGIFESKTLDGRSDPRLEFEAALAGVLLASDPAAVGRRIAALPQDQRADTLQQIKLSELTPAAQKDYFDLVRSLLPLDERDGPLNSAFSELIPDGDYQKSASFLDAIQATPEERISIAESTADRQLEAIAEERNLTRDDLAATREWLDRQSPAMADKLIGGAMGAASHEGGEAGFANLAKLILEVHASSGNDDALEAFLNDADTSAHPAEAQFLAGKISDPQRREEMLESLK